MKFFNVLPLTNKGITNLFSALSNQNIPGLKCKTKSLLESAAKSEGLSVEAFQDGIRKAHKDAYKVEAAYANLHYDGVDCVVEGLTYLIRVNGVTEGTFNTIMILQSENTSGVTMDVDGAQPNPMPARSIQQQKQYLQNLSLAHAHAAEVIDFIDSIARYKGLDKIAKFEEFGFKTATGVGVNLNKMHKLDEALIVKTSLLK